MAGCRKKRREIEKTWTHRREFRTVGETKEEAMDYKKTVGYRIGVVSAVVGVLLVLVYVVQLFVADLGLGFLTRPALPLCFLMIGLVFIIRAKRRAEKEEDTDQEDADS